MDLLETHDSQVLTNEANDVLVCPGLDVHHFGGRLVTVSAVGSDCVVVELLADAVESDPISGGAVLLDVTIAGLKRAVGLFVSLVFIGSVGYGLHALSVCSGCGLW